MLGIYLTFFYKHYVGGAGGIIMCFTCAAAFSFASFAARLSRASFAGMRKCSHFTLGSRTVSMSSAMKLPGGGPSMA